MSFKYSEYLKKINSKKVYDLPCKNCITLALCLAEEDLGLFDLLEKCSIICKFIIDEIESKYESSLKDIIDNELYKREDVETEIVENFHIWNALVLVGIEIGKEGYAFEQMEYYMSNGPDFEGFLEDALDILEYHKLRNNW
jgi:hypothetical protein